MIHQKIQKNNYWLNKRTKETAKVSDNSLDKNNNNNIENIKENIYNNKRNKIKIKRCFFFRKICRRNKSWKLEKINEDVSTYAPYPWELDETKKEKICCNCVVF